MDDLVEIKYIDSNTDWVVVTRFLATGMTGVEMREIDKKGPKLTLINNMTEVSKERTCTWKKGDYGSYGCSSYEYSTTCGENFDCDTTKKMNYCPNCGGRLN